MSFLSLILGNDIRDATRDRNNCNRDMGKISVATLENTMPGHLLNVGLNEKSLRDKLR